MIVFTYNKELERLNNLDNIISIVWHRRFFNFGIFEIWLNQYNNGYNKNTQYIKLEEREEIGKILTIELQNLGDKKTLIIKGYFLEHELNNNIVYPRFEFNGTVNNCIQKLLEISDIKGLLSDLPITSSMSIQELGEELGSKIYDVLAVHDFSYNLLIDEENKKIYFKSKKAKDKTINQNEISNIVFSENFQNITNLNYFENYLNYKNYAIIAGDGEGKDRFFTEVDNRKNGEEKKILFVDSRDLSRNIEGQTIQQYTEILKNRGIEKLKDYEQIYNITLDIVQGKYKYMEEYDIGDICTLKIESLNIEKSVQIIGIIEQFESSTHKIKIEIQEYTK